MIIEIQDSDAEFLTWALDLAGHNAKWWCEAVHSSDAERTLGWLRIQALTRIRTVITEANIKKLATQARTILRRPTHADLPFPGSEQEAGMLKALQQQGLITEIDKGQYRLTDTGTRIRARLTEGKL